MRTVRPERQAGLRNTRPVKKRAGPQLTLQTRTATTSLRCCTPPLRGSVLDRRAEAAGGSAAMCALLHPSRTVGVPHRAQSRCRERCGTGSRSRSAN